MSYVGSFRMRELFPLGKGGMGTTYLACTMGAAAFERLVVVKRLHDRHADDPIQRRRLIEEAELAACVHHAHVVSVVHAGQDSRGVFLVLDYIEGATLSQLRRQLAPGRVPTPVAVRVILDCLGGLAAIHGAKNHRGVPLQIVHRDITPENILVGLDGSTRVTDFGIAKGVHSAVHTEPSRLLGKTSYLAPEYIETGEFGPLADIYAMGVTLWTTLVGANPWRGLEEAQVLVRAMTMDIPDPPPEAGVPSELLPVLRRACARHPKDRFQSASEFARALELAVGPHQIADDAQVADLMQRVFQERSEKIRAAAADVLRTPSVPPPPAQPLLGSENPTTPAGIVKPAGLLPPLSLLPPASSLTRSGEFGKGRRPETSSALDAPRSGSLAEAPSAMATRPYPEEVKQFLGVVRAGATTGSESSASPPSLSLPEPYVEELGTDARGGTTIERVQRDVGGKGRPGAPLLLWGLAALVVAAVGSAAVLEARPWSGPRAASSSIDQGTPGDQGPSSEQGRSSGQDRWNQQGSPAERPGSDVAPRASLTLADADGAKDMPATSDSGASGRAATAQRAPAPSPAPGAPLSAPGGASTSQEPAAPTPAAEREARAADPEPTLSPPTRDSTPSSSFARPAGSGLVKRNPYRK